jgi:predicted dehydrogenase
VIADLGMHVLHLPLRLGWRPDRVFATIQDIVTERPGPDGPPVPCDTPDNATLHATVGDFPLTLETKRIAPGHTNTWSLRVLGLDGGVEFSTASPKDLWRFERRDGRQLWQREQTGSTSAFPTITGPIFEFGFPDAVLQMWAAYLAEREGELGGRLGCVTPREALQTHEIFDAALRSKESLEAERVASTA